MESVSVVRIIRIENDHKAQSIGAKLFFLDPAMCTVLKGDPGTTRETFVAACCAEAGWFVGASKDEMTGDFVISATKAEMPKITTGTEILSKAA